MVIAVELGQMDYISYDAKNKILHLPPLQKGKTKDYTVKIIDPNLTILFDHNSHRKITTSYEYFLENRILSVCVVEDLGGGMYGDQAKYKINLLALDSL